MITLRSQTQKFLHEVLDGFVQHWLDESIGVRLKARPPYDAGGCELGGARCPLPTLR